MNYESCVFLLVLPEAALLVLICVLLIFALFFGAHNTAGSGQKFYASNDVYNVTIKPDLYTPQTYAAIVASPTLQTEPIAKLAVAGLLCSCALYINNPLSYGHGYGLVVDTLGLFMSVALIISACACLVLGFNAYQRYSRYEFILILLLSLIGMLSVIKSYSFLSLYLSIECQSLSFYMLAAMHSRTEASAEAGLKYFILSAFSSAMLLLGMALVYGSIGSIAYGDITLACNHFAFYDSPMNTCVDVGLACIGVSLLFKLGAAPFHAWVADVYEGSATCITALFAICAKIAALTACIRLYSVQNMAFLLSCSAALSLIVGSLSALRQVKLKRLIAFSAIANAGWFLLGLICGNVTYTLIHLMVYTLLSINLFSIFILPLFRCHPGLGYSTRVLKAGPSAKSENIDHAAAGSSIKYISDLHQIYKINPSLAFCVSLSMFSLAGIPPLAGFYSKYLLINALTQTEQYLVLSLALAVAVISAFYYLRVVKTIYFGSAGPIHRYEPWFTLHELPWNAMLISCTSTLTLFFFVKPDYLCVMLNLISTV